MKLIKHFCDAFHWIDCAVMRLLPNVKTHFILHVSLFTWFRDVCLIKSVHTLSTAVQLFTLNLCLYHICETRSPLTILTDSTDSNFACCDSSCQPTGTDHTYVSGENSRINRILELSSAKQRQQYSLCGNSKLFGWAESKNESHFWCGQHQNYGRTRHRHKPYNWMYFQA